MGYARFKAPSDCTVVTSRTAHGDKHVRLHGIATSTYMKDPTRKRADRKPDHWLLMTSAVEKALWRVKVDLQQATSNYLL